MRIVPLNCLVLIVGQENVQYTRYFPEYEYIEPSVIRQEISNGNFRFNLEETVTAELKHRAFTKLKHGERVVVDIRHLDKNQRWFFVKSFSEYGVPIFYLVIGQDKEHMQGDGLAEIIDANMGVSPILPYADEYTKLEAKYNGITVIGDIHGMYDAMQTAIGWAKSRNHYIVLLGDILDYGPSSLECIDEAYRLVMRGEATVILGNHERKIMRWIDGHGVKLSPGNRITTDALDNLGNYAKSRWKGRFRGLYQNGHLVRKIGNVVFVHAAAHPAIWRGAANDKYIENHAFFGEIATKSDGAPSKPLLSHSWVNSIPDQHMVVVGHEIRSDEAPVVQSGQLGGKALFIDTGSGKGGRLSTADFKFGDGGLYHQNFNVF